ncbi:MAG TPA: hypothetical protein VFP31_01915 [Gaiellaceae bacterium]|nr:hypothetical protein [Gaiellaceae bacterium]
MGQAGLLLALVAASALLALWSYLRWPRAAPSKFGDAVLRVVIAFLLAQVGTIPLDAAVGISHAAAVLAVVGVVAPVLAFMFLASLWIMKLFAEQLKGYV